MISLTVDPDSQGQVYRFRSSTVTIGSESGGESHLVIQPEGDTYPVVTVSIEGEGFRLLCPESTPFVTLNGKPFTSILAEDRDLLTIGQVEILLEFDSPDDQPNTPVQLSEDEMDMLLEDLEEVGAIPEVKDTEDEEEDALEESEAKEEAAPVETESAAELTQAKPEGSKRKPEQVLDLEAELARLGEMLSEGIESISDEELQNLDIDRLLQEAEEESAHLLHGDQEEAKAAQKPEAKKQTPDESEQDQTEEQEESEETAQDGESTQKKDQVTLEFNEEEADAFLLKLPESLTSEVIKAEEPPQPTSVVPAVPSYNLDSPDVPSLGTEDEIPVAIIEEESEDDFEFFDDEDFDEEEDTEEELFQRRQQRNLLVTSAVLLLSVLMGFIAYITVDTRNTFQETQAVRGIADIGASLVHAQLRGKVPFNLNFKDPEFLSEEMGAVLTNEYRKRSPVDEHGEFKEAEYDLEIFSTSDLSRFLILALPRSGLIQTLIPRKTFLVESETLRIYRVDNIDPWLSLLRNGYSLDFVNPQDIRQQLALEQMIRLSSLDADEPEESFSPPDNLTLLDPQAENIIYVAPRYHKLSRALVDQVQLVLGENMRSEITIQGLHERIREVAPLQHLIVYVEGGKPQALEVQEGLRVFGLGRPFVVGYLETNQETRLVANAGLLETTPVKPSPLPDLTPHMAYPDISNGDSEEGDQDQADEKLPLSESVLRAHPLFATISRLVKERKEAQDSTNREIMDLLAEGDHDDPAVQEERQNQLIQIYESAKEKEDDKLRQELTRIFNEEVIPHWNTHRDIFLAILSEFQLQDLAPPHSQLVNPSPDYASSGTARVLMDQIGQSASLEELNNLVIKTKSQLEEEYKDNPSEIVVKKNQLRGVVLRRIGDFVLNPTAGVFGNSLRSHNRFLIDKILNDANVSDIEERNFYLQEFDMLVKRLHDLKGNSALKALRKQDAELSQKLEKAPKDDPIARQELLEKSFQNKLALEEREENIRQLEKQIHRVPLEVPHLEDPATTKEDLGRLGQQVLIQQRELPPSLGRDERLLDAIGLLAQATDEQRGFWQDILEIRNLLTSTPEATIEAVMNSEVGFGPTPAPLPLRIKNLAKDYLQAKRTLANQKNENLFQVEYQLFSKKYRPLLESILGYARTIESESSRLKKATHLYLERLNQLLSDYERARQQGLFVNARLHHSIQMHRLKRKVHEAEEMRNRIERLTQDMAEASQAFQKLVTDEIEQIDLRAPVTVQSVNQLQHRYNGILFPNLAGEDLKHVVDNIIGTPIKPVP